MSTRNPVSQLNLSVLAQVNAEPHMGSAYSTMAADAITRFQRLQGKRVTLVTGVPYSIHR